jgi:hypothetical protein
MKRISRIFFVLVIALVSVGGSSSANADTNCRQVARDIQSEGLRASTSDTTGQATVKVFTDALTSYPECKAEIETLYQWNLAQNPSSEFPFPKSGDPKTYPLGPISWWWDVLYNKLFGGNTLLMLLFGWELFLVPFPFIFVLISIPFRLIGEMLKKNRDL